MMPGITQAAKAVSRATAINRVSGGAGTVGRGKVVVMPQRCACRGCRRVEQIPRHAGLRGEGGRQFGSLLDPGADCLPASFRIGGKTMPALAWS